MFVCETMCSTIGSNCASWVWVVCLAQIQQRLRCWLNTKHIKVAGTQADRQMMLRTMISNVSDVVLSFRRSVLFFYLCAFFVFFFCDPKWLWINFRFIFEFIQINSFDCYTVLPRYFSIKLWILLNWNAQFNSILYVWWVQKMCFLNWINEFTCWALTIFCGLLFDLAY